MPSLSCSAPMRQQVAWQKRKKESFFEGRDKFNAPPLSPSLRQGKAYRFPPGRISKNCPSRNHLLFHIIFSSHQSEIQNKSYKKTIQDTSWRLKNFTRKIHIIFWISKIENYKDFSRAITVVWLKEFNKDFWLFPNIASKVFFIFIYCCCDKFCQCSIILVRIKMFQYIIHFLIWFSLRGTWIAVNCP